MNDEKKASISTSQLCAWVFDLAHCAALLRVASDLDMVSSEDAVLLIQTGLEKVLQIFEEVLQSLDGYK